MRSSNSLSLGIYAGEAIAIKDSKLYAVERDSSQNHNLIVASPSNLSVSKRFPIDAALNHIVVKHPYLIGFGGGLKKHLMEAYYI